MSRARRRAIITSVCFPDLPQLGFTGRSRSGSSLGDRFEGVGVPANDQVVVVAEVSLTEQIVKRPLSVYEGWPKCRFRHRVGFAVPSEILPGTP